MNQKQLEAGIFIRVTEELKIPKELKDYISKDDMGMEGLEFMMKNEKLSRKIPNQVRGQYEVLRFQVSELLEKEVERIRESLDEIKNHNEELIHSIIQGVCDTSK